MQHFTQDDKLNSFRLAVGWQYLVDNAGDPLNDGHFANYDKLVRACLQTGAHCIIDVHNYGRWNGKIMWQDGPTNDQFANLWKQFAAKYPTQQKIIFGLMNEPHDSMFLHTR